MLDPYRHPLTVELVPSTCWCTNVRSHLSKAVWDRLRRQVAAEAGHRCEICGGRGRRWPVECHEAWSYDDECEDPAVGAAGCPLPACHQVKHAGLAATQGRLDWVVRHLAPVSGWSREDAELYLEAAFETWAGRGRHQWTRDVSALATRYGISNTDE